MSASNDWASFFAGLTEIMISMLFILVGLSWTLDLLKCTGVQEQMMWVLAPVLHLAGVRREAGHLTAVGLFLGIFPTVVAF